MPEGIKYRRDAYDKLNEHYNKNIRINTNEEGLPDVPRPGIFQPDIPVTGPSELVLLAYKLLDENPRIKEDMKTITTGPTRAFMNELQGSKFNIEDLGRLNLFGIYNRGNIGINPMEPDIKNPHIQWSMINEQLKTLAHELGHAVGYDEAGADQGMNLLGDMPFRKRR